MNIVEKIQSLCKSHNIKITQLEKELSIGRGSISKWENAFPNSDNLMKIAKYFNVTTDYLLGLTDNPIPTIPTDEGIISIQRARTKMDTQTKKRMDDILKLAFEKEFSEDDL